MTGPPPKSAWFALYAAIAAWLFFFAGEGVGAFFTGDDVMNLQALHGLWNRPAWQCVMDLLNPFQGAYRPVGGLYYRAFWALFGFDPLPYRLFCYALLLADLLLAMALLRRFTASAPAVLLGMLLCAYHGQMVDLYFNGGTVYDLLAAGFFLGALLLADSAHPLTIALLAWLAIQSKEMAATLPLALLLWYLLVSRPRVWPLVSSAVVTALLMAVKLTSGHGLQGNELYRPRLDPAFILEQYAKYHNDLLGPHVRLDIGWTLTFCFLLVLAAAALRNRAMLFGAFFWIVTIGPVAVIPARSAFVLQLPLVGLALYAAAGLTLLFDRCLRWPVARYALAAALAAALAGFHLRHRDFHFAGNRALHGEARALIGQMYAQHPTLPASARLLFLDDPYPPKDWVMTFLMRLRYRDPAITVDRLKEMPGMPSPTNLLLYDRILRFQGGRLTERALDGEAAAAPLRVVFTPPVVRPGDPYEVRVEGLFNTPVDVRYVLESPRPVHAGTVERWCLLQEDGKARLVTPADHPAGVVRLVHIRASGGQWRPAQGALRIVR